MAVRKVSIHEAKTELSQLLRDVSRGVDVIITNRGRAVGRLVPAVDEEISLVDWVRKKEREGVLKPLRTRKPRALPPALPIPDEIARKFLEEDRNK